MGEFIAESDAAITQFLQSNSFSPPDHVQEHFIKTIKCITVYDEDRLMVIFIEGLQESIIQTLCIY